MRKSAKVLALTLGVLVLLGVVGAGAALAQTPTPANTATDWQSVFLGKVATILGVDEQQLANAMQQASKEVENERIDQAVQDGRMTQEYADWLKQRPDDGNLGIHGFGFGRRDFHGGKFGGRMGGPGGGMPGTQTIPTPTE